MATTIARSILALRSTGATASLLLSSTVSNPPPLPGIRLPHSLRLIHPTRVNPVRCLGVTRSLNSPASPVEMVEGHHRITMDKPGGEGATKQQMIDCYIQTLAKVLGSEEEAKKKMYNACFLRGNYGFGCEIDEKTSEKLKGLPGVRFVFLDFYADAENKDFGDELLVNGEIVQRSPERQRRIGPPPRDPRKPRYKKRVHDFPFVY